MKIKCPVKRCGKIFNHDGELKHHIVSEHSMDDVAETLVSQTFRIHENMKELENTPASPTNYAQNWLNSGKYEALKSLLEN